MPDPLSAEFPDIGLLNLWITGTYNARRHSEIGVSPVTSWCAQGWLPQMPGSLEDLDQLLVMVAKPRMVRRDGVRFQGLRFMSSTLAPLCRRERDSPL